MKYIHTRASGREREFKRLPTSYVRTHTHTKQTSHLKQTDYRQTGAGSIITTVTKHQNVIVGVNHHFIYIYITGQQDIQAILEA